LKSINGPELCRLLEDAGWKLKRVRGSHHIYGKTGERKILVVPVHGSRQIKPGLALRLAKDADIDL
jgi:predicted RNA binding protein YcfA (HicA-like mRNA interferase family)